MYDIFIVFAIAFGVAKRYHYCGSTSVASHRIEWAKKHGAHTIEVRHATTGNGAYYQVVDGYVCHLIGDPRLLSGIDSGRREIIEVTEWSRRRDPDYVRGDVPCGGCTKDCAACTYMP
jgi:hypothetical protein